MTDTATPPRNLVLCPSCEVGYLFVTIQTNVTIGSIVDADPPTTDDFVDAACDNPDCHMGLAQEPGDGRLRRAELMEDGEPTGPDAGVPELTERWIAAVTAVIAGGTPC